jgi:glutathione S-transferase
VCRCSASSIASARWRCSGCSTDHLAENEFLVGGRYTIADIAVYGYSHRAEEAQLELEPYSNLRAWFARVEAQPGYIEDVEPYPPNAAPGAGRSIYD